MGWRQSVRSFLFFFDSFQLYLYFIIYYNHREAATARDEKEIKRNEGKNKKLSSLLPVFTFSTEIKELMQSFNLSGDACRSGENCRKIAI